MRNITIVKQNEFLLELYLLLVVYGLRLQVRSPGSIRTGHQGIYMRICSGVRDRRPLPGHDPPSGVRPRR